jgi:hypothetical protein
MRTLAAITMTTQISSPYRNCQELFTNYPLAVRADNDSEAAASMVLMLHEGPAFFVLQLDFENDKPVYSIGPWPTGNIEEVPADDNPPVSNALANVLAYGVPIPQDGSLFGWIHADAVTALVIIYADESESPVPSWAIMPLAGTCEWQWPPFTGERFFGSWFWKHYWAGEVVCLGDLVAETPDTVFWVDTKAIIGSDCCVVERDISTSTGHKLRRGCYIYFQALRERKEVPALEVLVADIGKVDLAPRYDTASCGGS